ncbi:MAG: response regulator transcription factor [Treponema sp.]|nr:response regulator transcription factor [Candidatus Treponema merdequi]
MIALVDDEKNVRMTIKTALKKEGFETVEFANGQEIYDSVKSGLNPELIVMDIMMPVMDGIMCLKKLRDDGIKTPVMFLTSRDEEFDKVLGLELGADDYLCKPFSMRELVARIHVLLRRCSYHESALDNTDAGGENSNNKNILRSGSLELNLLSYTAKINQKSIELTVTEFRLLEGFLKNQNIVLSRDQLIEISYPEDTYLNDRAIDCHIKRLRKKLSCDENLSEKIQTVYGAGYKWE